MSDLLFDLTRDLRMAKNTEENAKCSRIAIEEKIAALVPGPERGQKTVTLEDGSKITVERGLNYKADIHGIEAFFARENAPTPIKTKTTKELDVGGYEWYREQDSERFSILRQFVTVTPKKVSIHIQDAK